jgi:hypothetical protein
MDRFLTDVLRDHPEYTVEQQLEYLMTISFIVDDLVWANRLFLYELKHEFYKNQDGRDLYYAKIK